MPAIARTRAREKHPSEKEEAPEEVLIKEIEKEEKELEAPVDEVKEARGIKPVELEWKPKFHLKKTKKGLEILYKVAVDVLLNH